MECRLDIGGADTTGRLTMTDLAQLAWFYAAWVVVSGIVLWTLARWSARQQLHVGVLLIAAVITLICVGLLVYAFAATPGPPRSPLRLLLANRGPPLLLLSFFAWPFVACAAVAQISRRLSVNLQATRWLSFACGTLISCLCPFALLAAGCGLAGVCL